MKNRLLPLFFSFFFLLFISSKGYATNITGGIFTNTTWTPANNPYILIDSVVIFEGVTLTIEPGVIIEFNDGVFIDQRGTLIANGTAGDTITFTSSSATPYPGIYKGITEEGGTLNSYTYCKFSYANTAISDNYLNLTIPTVGHCTFISNLTGYLYYSGIIDTCAFINNMTGLQGIGDGVSSSIRIQGCEFTCNGTGIEYLQNSVSNCTFSYNDYGIRNGVTGTPFLLRNCVFEYNSTDGIYLYNGGDTIEDCTIQYNGIGINDEDNYIFSNNISYNSIGIETNGDHAYSCNSICNNTVYNFATENFDNISAADNYWCATDTAAIQATIFDGHVNLNYGLVIFTPFETSACSNVGSTLSVSSINIADTMTVDTPSPICIGGSTILMASGGASYSWSPSTGLSSVTGATVTAKPAVTTTYTVTGRAATCYGDILSASVVVTVYPTPSLTVTPTPASYCAGESSTLTASGGISYIWSPSKDINATTGDSVTATPTVTTTYTVTGTNSNGCSATTTVVVKVNTTPTIAASPNPASFCPGGSSLLIASGGTTYTWSPSLDLSATTGAIVTANPTATTTYTVIDSSSCGKDTTTVIVTVTTNLIITVNSPPTICSGNSVTLSATGATNYSWSPSTDLIATTGNSVTATPTITTTYTVTGSSGTGCAGTNTVTVTVNPTPTITVTTNPVSYCSGGSSTLTASGGDTYTWSPSTDLSATIGEIVTANPTVTIPYTVTGTNSFGCPATTIVIVSVSPIPMITATPYPASYCVGGSSTLIASGGDTYTWSPSTDLSTTTGAIVSANPPVTTTYIVTGTNSSGCLGISNIIVTVNPTPAIIVTPSPASYCSGGSSTLTASGGNTYTWSPSTDLNETTGVTVTANPTITNTYTITGTNSNGCSATNTVTVAINPNPTITASPNPSYCDGGSATLDANGGITYTWSPSTDLSTTTGATVTANPTITSTYIVTGTNSYACSTTDTVIVTVNPNPTITAAGNPTSICTGGITTLTATGGNTYTWSPSTDLDATTGAIVAANPTETTTYIVIGTNSSGCQGAYTLVVTVSTSATVTASALPSSYCENGSATLTASGCQTYTWSPSTALSTTTGDAVTASPTVTTTYTIDGSSGGGCTGTTIVIVTVNPNPTITVNTPAPICIGDSTTLTASGATTYTWTPATGLNATTEENVIANPIVTTIYTVTGTNSYFCSATDTVTVTVNHGPNTPTITDTDNVLTSSATQSNQWYLDGTEINGATKKTYKVTDTGCYWTIATNLVNGCSTISDTICITSLASINQLSINPNQLSIYPNPTGGEIFVNISSSVADVKDWNLQITDVLGRTVYTKLTLNYSNDIDLSTLPSGVYFISVINKTDRAVVPVVKE